MTNKEAISILCCPDAYGGIYGKKFGQALTLAIELLRKENKMTGNEYQQLAMRTTKDEWRGQHKWDQKMHAILGLNSEAGEVAGIVQKMYQGHVIKGEHIKKELGDCMWFIAECCDAFGFSLDDVMQTNIDKLRARYPDGFDTERSLHRAEGDI